MRVSANHRFYEAWGSPDGSGLMFLPAAAVASARADGSLEPGAILLHRVEARTWEQAMARHHETMGWGDYQPHGPLQPCPNQCGESYYPEGSAQCPNCGLIESSHT
jgi:hypothetical protein